MFEKKKNNHQQHRQEEKKKAKDPFIHFDKINVSIDEDRLRNCPSMITYVPIPDNCSIIFSPDAIDRVLEHNGLMLAAVCKSQDASEDLYRVQSIVYNETLSKELTARFFKDINNNVNIIFEGGFKAETAPYISSANYTNAPKAKLDVNIFKIDQYMSPRSSESYILSPEEFFFAAGSIKNVVLSQIRAAYEGIINSMISLSNRDAKLNFCKHYCPEITNDNTPTDVLLSYCYAALNELSFVDMGKISEIIDIISINVFSLFMNHFINIPEIPKEKMADPNYVISSGRYPDYTNKLPYTRNLPYDDDDGEDMY